MLMNEDRNFGEGEDGPFFSTFEDTFAPLAHHLFPDGVVPQQVEIWPRKKDRTIVPVNDARSSMTSLGVFSGNFGLNSEQQWSVVIAACATLPKEHQDDMTVGAGSPLVDCTCASFCALIKCIVPKETISFKVATKLLSEASTTPACNSRAKATVLRFLTLAVRNAVLENRHGLSCLYGVVFDMVSDPAVAPDAVRLLHALTRKRHVRIYRAKRLQKLYKDFEEERYARACVLLLLQLYAQYDPVGCGPLFPTAKHLGSAYSQCFKLPDEKWERDFAGERFVDNDSSASAPVQEIETNGDGHNELMPPTKRPRLLQENVPLGSTISSTLDWLEHAFEGVHSFSRGTRSGSAQVRREVRASTLLMDVSVRHLIVLSTKKGKKDVCDTEVIRLRACLPYMLHEEWYLSDARSEPYLNHSDSEKSNSDSSVNEYEKTPRPPNEPHGSGSPYPLQASRQRVLEALASMALHAEGLVPEAEAFVIDEILPHWDGSLSFVGVHLCNDLLPFLSPCSFSELQSKVLVYLSPLIIYGSPKTQHTIVSGALASLLGHWGRLDWTSASKKQKSANDILTRKHRTLHKLIQWTEKAILTAMLVAGGGHELLCLASMTFFRAVAGLTDLCSVVVTPSPSLMYRLLLSRSVLCIDSVCQLLVTYKNVFSKLKAQVASSDEGSAENDEFDRLVVFNSFIWDFCSALWRCSPLPSIGDLGTNSDNRTKSILYTDLPHETLHTLQDDSICASSALSVSHGAAFCGYACDFHKHHSPTRAPESFHGKLKLEYLDYLEKKGGMKGLHTFLTTFVASLANRDKSSNMP